MKVNESQWGRERERERVTDVETSNETYTLELMPLNAVWIGATMNFFSTKFVPN